MKRNLLVVLLVMISALCLAFGISACGGGSTQTSEVEEGLPCTITFDANGGVFTDGSKTLEQIVEEYSFLTVPEEPTLSGCTFAGWAANENGTQEWDFTSDIVTEDITLYAIWSEDDSLAYELSDDGTYYIVIGIGDLSGDVQVPETYKNIPVTTIAEGAFTRTSGLTSIVISDCVTEIEAGAFSNCTKLESVAIGEGVTTLRTETFYKCSNLTEIKLPASLATIEQDAFNECTTFTDVYFAGTLSQWAMIDFYFFSDSYSSSVNNPIANAENFYINDEVVTEVDLSDATYISATAFYRYDKITSVVIGSSVLSIGDYAFAYCKISSLELSNKSSVTIGDGAFLWSNITTLTIPDSTVSVGYNAFGYSQLLTAVTIGNGVMNIGDEAFGNCNTLSSVTLGDSVQSIGAYAFSTAIFTSIVLPASLLYIGIWAFNSSLASATFKNTINWYANGTALSEDIISDPEIAAKYLTTTFLNGGYWDCEWERPTLVFTLNSDNVSYTVSNKGTEIRSSIEIPSTFNGLPVTAIADSGFYNCTALQSITIPESVTTIGNSAFYGCAYLTSVSMPSSVTLIGDYAFEGCSYLTNVSIPGSVTSIGYKAFYNCSSITSITISENVTAIGNFAFYNCESLKTIYYNAIAIEDSDYGIFGISSGSGSNSLKVDNKLASFKLQQNIVLVVTIGSKVERIPANLFSYSKVNSIIFADNSVCEVLGDNAFYRCTSLTSITIPDSVTSIGRYAFSDCTSLTSVTIPDSVTSIGSVAFGNCESLTSVSIGDSVTSIGDNAFCRCYSLTSVSIGDSVTSIGAKAFWACKSLISITIPDGVKIIGDEAFLLCTSLTSVTIPNSVTSIGIAAFNGCSSLPTVYYSGTASEWNLISIGSINDYLTTATIYYYSESEPDYTDGYNYWHYVNGEIVVWTKTTEE